MSQERSEAVVLRAVDFSESSRIVTFLTPGRGKLACMAAGVKRPKNDLAALLDTFNRVELVYYWRETRSVQKLAEASIIDRYPGVKGDLEKGAFAAVPLELAYKTAHENEPSEELYNVLVNGLKGMDTWLGDARTHACWQLLQLLAAAGFEPDLESAPRSLEFSYATGLVRGRGDQRLIADEVLAMQKMKQSPDKCPDVQLRRRAFNVVVKYAEHHLESGFRSARILDDMFSRA